jgi:transposase-like protein
MPIEKILVENSSYVSSNSLRKRLLKEKIKEPKCECCGATEWLGNPIALELHHVNGIKDDLRIENLQILCPNCHAFTDNYRGKNQGKSAQKETSDVEPLKLKETLTGNADGNLEPSLTDKCKKGAETRREESKSLIKYYCAYCGKEMTRAKRRQKYCSQECAHAVVSKRPGVTELLEAFKTYKSYVQVGKHFNVSDNAVHKWVQLYKIKDMIKE